MPIYYLLLFYLFLSSAALSLAEQTLAEDVEFSLKTSAGVVRLVTKKTSIDASQSKLLDYLYKQALKTKAGKNGPAVILLNIKNIPAWQKIIIFLEQGRIDIRDCYELSSLVLYAHWFRLESLKGALLDQIKNGQFNLSESDLSSRQIFRLSATLGKLISRKKGDQSIEWCTKILDWLVNELAINSQKSKYAEILAPLSNKLAKFSIKIHFYNGTFRTVFQIKKPKIHEEETCTCFTFCSTYLKGKLSWWPRHKPN